MKKVRKAKAEAEKNNTLAILVEAIGTTQKIENHAKRVGNVNVAVIVRKRRKGEQKVERENVEKTGIKKTFQIRIVTGRERRRVKKGKINLNRKQMMVYRPNKKAELSQKRRYLQASQTATVVNLKSQAGMKAVVVEVGEEKEELLLIQIDQDHVRVANRKADHVLVQDPDRNQVQDRNQGHDRNLRHDLARDPNHAPNLGLDQNLSHALNLDRNPDPAPNQDLNLNPGQNQDHDPNLHLDQGLDLVLSQSRNLDRDLNQSQNLDPDRSQHPDLDRDPTLDQGLNLDRGQNLDHARGLILDLSLGRGQNQEVGQGVGLDLVRKAHRGVVVDLGVGLDRQLQENQVLVVIDLVLRVQKIRVTELCKINILMVKVKLLNVQLMYTFILNVNTGF